jgi:ornithine cyclodeaminase
MEASTGARLGLLDGATVTARRTAALSLLAARELAPRPEGPLLIVGAGAQGRSHLEAFREGLGVSKVFVASRTPAGAESSRPARRTSAWRPPSWRTRGRRWPRWASW